MDIKLLKKDVDDLPDIKKEMHIFIKELEYIKERFPDYSTRLDMLITESSKLKELDEVKKKLSVLYYNLHSLKISDVMGDRKRRRLLISKFMTDPYYNLRKLITEIKLHNKRFDLLIYSLERLENELNDGEALDNIVLVDYHALSDKLRSIRRYMDKKVELVQELSKEFINSVR